MGNTAVMDHYLNQYEEALVTASIYIGFLLLLGLLYVIPDLAIKAYKVIKKAKEVLIILEETSKYHEGPEKRD